VRVIGEQSDGPHLVLFAESSQAVDFKYDLGDLLRIRAADLSLSGQRPMHIAAAYEKPLSHYSRRHKDIWNHTLRSWVIDHQDLTLRPLLAETVPFRSNCMDSNPGRVLRRFGNDSRSVQEDGSEDRR